MIGGVGEEAGSGGVGRGRFKRELRLWALA